MSTPQRGRRRATTRTDTADGPRSFKDRMAAGKTLAEAANDGYKEVVRDDRLDYCGFPMIVDKWLIKHEDTTYNGKHHARVWAEVAVETEPEPVRIRFWDYGGRLGEQLLEFERCGTRGGVVGILDAREYEFGRGEVGYEYFLADLPETEHPALETSTEDAPGY